MDDSFSDSDNDPTQSDLFNTDQLVNDRLLSKLILLLPTLPEIPEDAFSQFDLRVNSDGKASIITDNMYALHVAYLFWKGNRKLNEAIPLIIQKSIESIKPKVKEDRKLLRSFVQKRLTEFSLKVTDDGRLLMKGNKIVLSKGMLRTTVEWYHDELNHPKFTALIKVMKSHFYIWGLDQTSLKTMYSELQCDICSSNQLLPKRTHLSHIKSFEVFDRIQIDLTQIAFGDQEDILSKKGFKWVLTVIDCFSKYAWAYPLKSKETNRICLLLYQLFLSEGIPKILQSDNGGEFVSTLIRNLMPKLGIKLVNGAPYSPTTQGQIERFNRTFKNLLRKEIQIELSLNNFQVIEDWGEILIPRVIDSYIHKLHRSLSRTPWELYKNRTSPHPKTSLPIESINSQDIELCCMHPNPELKSLDTLCDLHDLKGAIRNYADNRERLNLETLTQTRKVQVENYKQITKKNSDQNFEVGAIAFMRNPLVSKMRKKKNFLETLNVKVRVLKKHLLSNQYQVEYTDSKGDPKHKWVHNTELLKEGNSSPEIVASNENYFGESIACQLSFEDYRKLVTKFEQHIAEIWCNGRKMRYKLVKTITTNDKEQFGHLDSRMENNAVCNSGNKLHFYGELVFEILDDLFLQFCAKSFSTEYTKDSTACMLKYLAHNGFNQHLGSLQYWYRSRFDDERGRHFCKVQELQDPSTKHFCEECAFSDDCTHECCFKLLTFNFRKKSSFRLRTNDECKEVKSSLGKRKREELYCSESDKSDDILSNISIDEKQPSRTIEEVNELDLFVKIPLDNVRTMESIGEINEEDQLFNLPSINIQTNKSCCKKFKSIDSTNKISLNSEDFFKPVTKEWRRKTIKEKLNIKISIEHTIFIPNNILYKKLKDCVAKKKISIIPDGNCFYRALSWWLAETEDFHELIREKIVEFMRKSTECEQYVKNKSDQNIEEYISENNTMTSTIWATDVEIFSAAIWLETDIFTLINGTWNKFSHQGFNPKKGRNMSSSLGIYLENAFCHYEPIISVIRKC